MSPSIKHYSLLINFAKWGWLHGIGGFLLAVADRLLVGLMLGAEALAFYSLLLMFPQQVHSLTAAGVSVTFPKISAMLSSGDVLGARMLAKKITIITFMSGLPIALTLIAFSENIFQLWLGKALPQDAMAAMAPLSIAFFILCLNVGPYYALLGMGQVRYVALLNLIAGIASVATLVAALPTYGLLATALSKAIYGCIMLIQFHGLNKYLKLFVGERS